MGIGRAHDSFLVLIRLCLKLRFDKDNPLSRRKDGAYHGRYLQDGDK